MIAPVAYQEPALVGVVEGATEVAVEGAMGVQPIADAMSVVESPITETGPVYSDAGGITEGGNVMAGGETIVLGGETMAAAAPSCGCGGASTPTAMPTEGLISTSPAGYQSAPVTYASAAPAAAPCCTPARRGFFRTLFGR
jgi:hypothetical protein